MYSSWLTSFTFTSRSQCKKKLKRKPWRKISFSCRKCEKSHRMSLPLSEMDAIVLLSYRWTIRLTSLFSKIRSYWRWTFLRSVSEGLEWSLLPEFIWIFIYFDVRTRIKECLYVLLKSVQFHMACELVLCFIQTCSVFCYFLCRGVFCLRHFIVFYVFCRTLSDDWEQHSL